MTFTDMHILCIPCTQARPKPPEFRIQQSKESRAAVGGAKLNWRSCTKKSVSDTGARGGKPESAQASIFWMMGRMFPPRRALLRYACLNVLRLRSIRNL